MVQKSDGGYGYDTTDLAASRYRLQHLGVNRVIILTDVGQFPHFDLIFRASFIAGWAVEGQHKLDHMGFGLIQNENGGKMATRDGGNVKLMDLLDEAKARAKDQILERIKGTATEGKDEEVVESTTKLTEDEIELASEIMGIDAVKYYDLNQNRIQNYKFSYAKMLSPKGNTAVYLLYSYARINSIITKSGISEADLKNAGTVKITDEYETVILAQIERVLFTHNRWLTTQIAKFCEIILSVSDELKLNTLCAYLYEFSGIIASGYKKYKILGNEHTTHRVQILYISKVVFDRCFYLLGLKTLPKI